MFNLVVRGAALIIGVFAWLAIGREAGAIAAIGGIIGLGVLVRRRARTAAPLTASSVANWGTGGLLLAAVVGALLVPETSVGLGTAAGTALVAALFLYLGALCAQVAKWGPPSEWKARLGRAVDRAMRTRDRYRRCPHCAEPILVQARACKHCHRDVIPKVESLD
jgi:hypothetical protein